MQISWRDMNSNEQVLKVVPEKRSLMDFIWVGHILRGANLLRVVA